MKMNINIYHLIKGAQKATGLTVIIDVFRAFSVACYLFNNGTKKIIPVGEIETAYQIKKNNPEFILIGERDGKKLPDCDYGNSPAEIENINCNNKTIIHTTSAGTQGLVNAVNAEQIITGSFVNLGAIVSYIKKIKPDQVSLVCMGIAGKEPAAEDEYCAKFIKDRLKDKSPLKFEKIKLELKKGEGAKFFDKNKPWFKERDFQLCMQLNQFDFVLKAITGGEGEIYLKKLCNCSP